MVDGSLSLVHTQAEAAVASSSSSNAAAAAALGGASRLAAAVPRVPPIAAPDLDRLADFVQASRGVLVLTGAGCSTESAIPDYRGPGGAYSTGFKPMTHQQFMASPQNRARYWARSFAGWLGFSGVEPNAAHDSLARLQRLGWVEGLVTQNVDRLHHRAGSQGVLELHGTTHRVVCMGCGHTSCREEFQQLLAALNPAAAEVARQLAAAADLEDERQRYLRAGTSEDVPAGLRERRATMRPDGDVEIETAGSGFLVPPCSSCGGTLKPDVVFFGDSIPQQRAADALEQAQACRALLVVGSSLAVWSAFRLVKAAKEGGAPLAILTAGDTRADELADLKLEAVAGETLARLAAHPALAVPPLR